MLLSRKLPKGRKLTNMATRLWSLFMMKRRRKKRRRKKKWMILTIKRVGLAVKVCPRIRVTLRYQSLEVVTNLIKKIHYQLKMTNLFLQD